MAAKKASKQEKKVSRSPFLPGLAVFDAFIVAFALFVGTHLVITSQAFARGIGRLTASEQEEHRQAMLDIIRQARADTVAADESVATLSEIYSGELVLDVKETDPLFGLTSRDSQVANVKSQLYRQIDGLNKDSMAIDKAYDEYVTDISVSLNPYRDMDIERFVFHSRDLLAKIQRLSGRLDDLLYDYDRSKGDGLSYEIDKSMLVKQDFANVYWEIKRLNQEGD